MIVSSRIAEDAVQVDRRRSVHEIHVDDVGVEYHVFYLAESGARVDNILSAHATQLEADLAVAAQAREALRVAERAQATELLALTDDQIAKILIIPIEEVPKTRDELDDRLEDTSG